MKFKISKQIFEKFPNLKIGIIKVTGIDNAGKDEEVLKLLNEQQKEIQENFTTETLSQNSKIDVWRKAYSSFGAKPKKYKCSVENLYRMILKDIKLNHINKIVDIYNYISLKHLVPVGGDDIDHVDGNIILKFADGTEPFTQLNSEEMSNPKEGEAVYVDDKEVLCRRWNWRECDKSKMTESTNNATLVVEGLGLVSEEEMNIILEELKNLVQKYCGGESKVFILNTENPEIEF
jgi:DNA/RNA-binding domain of Phe-tRNA-synthetase-like protein